MAVHALEAASSSAFTGGCATWSFPAVLPDFRLYELPARLSGSLAHWALVDCASASGKPIQQQLSSTQLLARFSSWVRLIALSTIADTSYQDLAITAS